MRLRPNNISSTPHRDQQRQCQGVVVVRDDHSVHIARIPRGLQRLKIAADRFELCSNALGVVEEKRGKMKR